MRRVAHACVVVVLLLVGCSDESPHNAAGVGSGGSGAGSMNGGSGGGTAGSGGAGGMGGGKPDYGGYRPHYQGFGASSKGGRGGEICIVDQLGNSGPGSLRDCVERATPRFVLFEVSGNIHDHIVVANPYITIAGQTAPSPGVTLSGSITVDTNDVVVQHLRVRGNTWGVSTFYFGVADTGDNTNVHEVVFDHMSLSWSHGVTLGGISPGGAHGVLMIDSIASEALSLDWYYPQFCGGTPGQTANCSGAGVL